MFRGHSDWVPALACCGDGRRLATRSREGVVRRWDRDVRSEPNVVRVHASYVDPIALSPDGRRLVSGAWDGLLDGGGALFRDGLSADEIIARCCEEPDAEEREVALELALARLQESAAEG